MPKKKTPLQRLAYKSGRQPVPATEQRRYYNLMGRAVNAANRAARQGSSVGRVTNAERKAVRYMTRATRLITTPGEAQGTRKIARRRAKRS